MKRGLWSPLLGLFYVIVIAVLGGLKADHVFIGSLALLDAYNHKTRLYLRYFFPFILTGVLYDSTRYYYWGAIDGRVHVSEPYFRDLRWFGIPVDMAGSVEVVTPNEYFQLNAVVWLDLLCGFAYLIFVGEYLALAFYLFLKNHLRRLWAFAWCFFSVNVLGYLTYFIYPAAPPWYVEKYGFGPALMYARPDAAAARRFDEYLGTHFFDEIYGRGIAVYGAYPSLHVAYPLLVIWISCCCAEMKWFRIPAIAFYLLMCLSAVYLQHHYVVDILLGSLYAVVVATIASWVWQVGPGESQCRPAGGELAQKMS